MATPPILHIHSQKYEHDEVRIVGTTEALKSLRDHINLVLSTERSRPSRNFFCSDGEGFKVIVQIFDGTWEEWADSLPY